jgi:hypothetical protein
MHLNTQQMRALKATIWLTIPVTNCFRNHLQSNLQKQKFATAGGEE